LRAIPVHKDQSDLKDRLDRRASRDRRDSRATKVTPETRVHKDPRGMPELWDRKAHRVFKANKVR
jgi:hypothetical protein